METKSPAKAGLFLIHPKAGLQPVFGHLHLHLLAHLGDERARVVVAAGQRPATPW